MNSAHHGTTQRHDEHVVKYVRRSLGRKLSLCSDCVPPLRKLSSDQAAAKQHLSARHGYFTQHVLYDRGLGGFCWPCRHASVLVAPSLSEAFVLCIKSPSCLATNGR